MLYRMRIFCILLVLLVVNKPMLSQDAEDQAAQMQIWTEYMTPSTMS